MVRHFRRFASERVAAAAIEPSVQSKGDSNEYALAATINGLYQAELIDRRPPWKTRVALKLATLDWVSLFSHHRLLEPIGDIPMQLRQTTTGN